MSLNEGGTAAWKLTGHGPSEQLASLPFFPPKCLLQMELSHGLGVKSKAFSPQVISYGLLGSPVG